MSSAEAPSRLRQSAIEVIEAYNTWDLSKMMAVRAPECINQVLPSTSPPKHTTPPGLSSPTSVFIQKKKKKTEKGRKDSLTFPPFRLQLEQDR